MAKSFNELTGQALQIKNAVMEFENDALRIGTMHVDTIDKMKEVASPHTLPATAVITSSSLTSLTAAYTGVFAQNDVFRLEFTFPSGTRNITPSTQISITDSAGTTIAGAIQIIAGASTSLVALPSGFTQSVTNYLNVRLIANSWVLHDKDLTNIENNKYLTGNLPYTRQIRNSNTTSSNPILNITNQYFRLSLYQQTESLLIQGSFNTEYPQGMVEVTIKDNGAAQAITFESSILIGTAGVTAPTATIPGKTLVMRFVYDFEQAKWNLCYNSYQPFVWPSSINPTTRRLYDSQGRLMYDWDNNIFYDNSQHQTANMESRIFKNWQGYTIMNWQESVINDEYGIASIRYSERNSMDSSNRLAHNWEIRRFFDNSNRVSLDYQARRLYNSTSGLTLDYGMYRMYDTNGYNSINYGSRMMYDTSGNNSLNYGSREMYDSSNVLSLSYQARILAYPNGNFSINYQYGQIVDTVGQMSINYAIHNLYDTSGQPSINYGNHRMDGANGILSIDYGYREMYDSDGNVTIDYSNCKLLFQGMESFQWTGDKIGFFGRLNSQADPIPDATDLPSLLTSNNAILAALRSYGLIAT